jgi:hypothetical protein
LSQLSQSSISRLDRRRPQAWDAHFRSYRTTTLRPNPSLKRRANGVPPGPRGCSAYHQPRGPVVTPSPPA